MIFGKQGFYENDQVVNWLTTSEIDLIVLAGFLWLVPPSLTRAFPNKIINVHPALLPKFGGKGMWGHHVHEAVVANGEAESGMTIHFVNEHYDEGQIIFQAKCPILKTDTPDQVAAKVMLLEHCYYPKIIEDILIG